MAAGETWGGPTAFGPRWHSVMTEHATWVPTPVGERCLFCEEPIEEGDQGFLRGHIDASGKSSMRWAHGGCDAIGVVGHIYGVCSCTGWDTTTKAAGDELWRRLDGERQRD